MSLPEVFVTRTIQKEVLETISSASNVTSWDHSHPIPYKQLVAACINANGIYAQTSDQIDKNLIQQCPSLKVISVVGTGVNNVDVSQASDQGIVVGNTPGVTAKSTADMAIGLLLASARRIVEADRWVHDGNWKHDLTPLGFLSQEVHGSVAGIVGLGQIGLEFAKRLRSFDVEVVYFSRTRKPQAEHDLGLTWVSTLRQLLNISDFVSIHVPLTSDTEGMIGESEINLMKQNAILINTSRGPVVDQQSLYTALKNNHISGAALDVTSVEPIAINDPLLKLSNVVISPHIATATHKTRLTMAIIAKDNLISGLNERPLPHCVNPEVYSQWTDRSL